MADSKKVHHMQDFPCPGPRRKLYGLEKNNNSFSDEEALRKYGDLAFVGIQIFSLKGLKNRISVFSIFKYS